MNTRRLFASNLRYMRLQKEISIQDISVDLDVQVSRYRMWEAGKAVPGCELLLGICDFFNVPLDDLFRVNMSEVNYIII